MVKEVPAGLEFSQEMKDRDLLAKFGVKNAKSATGPNADYFWVTNPQMHWRRKKLLLEQHPDLQALTQPDSTSMLHVLVIVATQFALTWAFSVWLELPWWCMPLLAYALGCFLCHALWVLIHDATHDAVSSSRSANLLTIVVANLVHIFPTGMTFRYYHLRHHSHLNVAWEDPDLPLEWEHAWFGTTALGKFLWMAAFPAFQGLRTLHDRNSTHSHLDKWTLLNDVSVIAIDLAVFWLWGWRAVLYMVCSSLFAISLHPLGARWIAEHYSVDPPQETYSYYGVLNLLAYNIGYHNEHHDLPSVPWSRLPELRRRAPEFYDNLAYHVSYFAVLWHFIMDSGFSLKTRVVRKPAEWQKRKEK